MATARVKVEEQIKAEKLKSGWVLCFQWCTYKYEDESEEHGYRFIYRDNNNKLRPQRGQARIPNLKMAQRLIDKAIKEGWGTHEGELV